MNSLTQPFRFPKKLWVIVSLACFVFLFVSQPVNFKDNQPTAWKLLVHGEIGAAAFFGLFWIPVASVFGAFVAAVLGIVRQLLWSHK